MALSPEEIEAMARKVVEVIRDSEIFVEKTDFFQQPEEHYNSHKRLDRFLTFFENIESNILRALIVLFITGLILISALPFIIKKGV